MVVMDYVKPLSRDLPQTVRPQIEQILRELHRNGYVFGDLRQPNIILNQANKIQLIDFDWAGRYDMTIQDSIPDDLQELIPADILEPTNVIQAQTDTTFAHYPLNLSKTLFSSTGAGDLQPIRPIHDWRMLNKLTFTH
jgi:serine/threonine protein kinase